MEVHNRAKEVHTPLIQAMDKAARIDYTNYKGERSIRHVVPCSIWHGSTEYHADAQWYMMAWDTEKKVYRNFAIKGIHSWKDL
jgi:predicted DNA-binding transcriptional regulator YafY